MLQAVGKWVRQLIVVDSLQTRLINRTLHTFQRTCNLSPIKYEQYSLTSAGWLFIHVALPLSFYPLLSLSLSLYLCAALSRIIATFNYLSPKGNADALTRPIMLISSRWDRDWERERGSARARERERWERVMLFNCSLMFIAACKFASSCVPLPAPSALDFSYHYPGSIWIYIGIDMSI